MSEAQQGLTDQDPRAKWELNIHVYYISYYATQSDKTAFFQAHREVTDLRDSLP